MTNEEWLAFLLTWLDFKPTEEELKELREEVLSELEWELKEKQMLTKKTREKYRKFLEWTKRIGISEDDYTIHELLNADQQVI